MYLAHKQFDLIFQMEHIVRHIIEYKYPSKNRKLKNGKKNRNWKRTQIIELYFVI